MRPSSPHEEALLKKKLFQALVREWPGRLCSGNSSDRCKDTVVGGCSSGRGWAQLQVQGKGRIDRQGAGRGQGSRVGGWKL